VRAMAGGIVGVAEGVRLDLDGGRTAGRGAGGASLVDGAVSVAAAARPGANGAEFHSPAERSSATPSRAASRTTGQRR